MDGAVPGRVKRCHWPVRVPRGHIVEADAFDRHHVQNVEQERWRWPPQALLVRGDARHASADDGPQLRLAKPVLSPNPGD